MSDLIELGEPDSLKGTFVDQLRKKDAEIERLKADAENLRNTITSIHLSLKERDAEIERQNGLVAMQKKDMKTAMDEMAKLQAEIERLRKEVAYNRKDMHALRDECRRLEGHNAKLQAVVDAADKRDASCLDSGCEEGSHKPWCDHANPAALEDDSG